MGPTERWHALRGHLSRVCFCPTLVKRSNTLLFPFCELSNRLGEIIKWKQETESKAEANDLSSRIGCSFLLHNSVILSSCKKKKKSLQFYNSLLLLYVSMVYVQMQSGGHPLPCPLPQAFETGPH